MKTIYKYPIKIEEKQEIEIPFGAMILSVQLQNGNPYLWAKVETGNSNATRIIYVFGTSQPIEIKGGAIRYIDTLQTGVYVWHVFEGVDSNF